MSKKRKRFPGRRLLVDLTRLNFEVTNEPKINHSEAVNDILDRATPLLKIQNGPEAEKLFRQALELELGQPDLLHNLAVSLALQGRHTDALAIVNRLFQEHPDYLFSRTGLARRAMQAGDLQKAANLLELLLRQGDLLSARTWFNMWKDSNPKNPKLEQFLPFFKGGDR